MAVIAAAVAKLPVATCCGCGCGDVTPEAKTPGKAPEKAAPLPMAPKADPSAANGRGIYQAAPSLVRN